VSLVLIRVVNRRPPLTMDFAALNLIAGLSLALLVCATATAAAAADATGVSCSAPHEDW
jgi:hypothetical protein